MVSNRHAKASTRYVGKSFDKSKPYSCIMLFVANNLYGWAMSQKLPTHGLKWMRNEDSDDWRNKPHTLEVYLRYCDEFHDLHNDYHVAPEQLKVNQVIKLISNLNEMEKYVLDSEILKLYESLGLEIIEIHKCVMHEKSDWLKQYTEMNTTLRAKAKMNSIRTFFKLMNNFIYGKMVENVDKRADIRLVTNKEMSLKLAACPIKCHKAPRFQ